MTAIQLSLLPLLEAPPRWDVRAWRDRLFWLASWDRWRASTPCYQRFEKHARELTTSRVQAMTADELDVVIPLLERTRHHPARLLCEQRRCWEPDELGEMLVEARNRAQLLALGREQARERGPRFDPTLLPDAALDRLIQRHRDMAVVEQLRDERARRVVSTRAREEGGNR